MSGRRATRLVTGGRIDRARPLRFSFNGRMLSGYAGDTLASALLANGVDTVARSCKYHRPRGIYSAGVEEPSALLRVQLGAAVLPITRATLQPLVDGLVAQSENCFPSVGFDLGRGLDLLHRFWPAGFYNKTFMWPRWELYEGLIRRAAGLARVPAGTDATAYHRHNLHCEVLVVGGGAAGLAAALAAARAGAEVVVIEQDCEFGGRLLGERGRIEEHPAAVWVDAAVAELARLPHVRLMPRTLVAGYYDHNVLTAHDLADAEHPRGRVERFWRIRARQVVLATGAIEQPLVFAHNDRPGILLAGAVRQYLHRYAVAPGRRLVVASNHDEAYQTACDWRDAGLEVAAIVDARAAAGAAAQASARQRGIEVIGNAVITATRGAPAVSAVEVQALARDGRAVLPGRRRIDCDLVGVSAGWNPSVHLYSQAGGSVQYEPHLACIVPVSCRQRVGVVGGANGEFALQAALARAAAVGRRAAAVGRRAAAAARGDAAAVPEAEATRRQNFGIGPIRFAPGGATDRQWVDLAHDVTTADIDLAVRENYVAVEHLKRYTTNGMAVDQGKTSNLNALIRLAEQTGRPVAEVGTTTFRPQFLPVTLGAIAGGAHGDLYSPARHLPALACHRELQAMLEDYGGWKRPACYPRPGESREQAIEREVRAVRQCVGLFDGSPLGKIEIRGPDAAEFLHRIYANSARNLQPGRLRYGLMLNENGIVFDDGVFGCLAPDLYLVNTTAAGAERVAGWLDEWHQCEWTQLDIVIMPVTTQWAVLTLAGAQARALLQRLDSDIDFSAAAFPHMHLRTGSIAGVSARVQRVSFSGELSYEVSVPADRAEWLWRLLLQHGAQSGVEPVGVEAWLVLRLEKGFLHVGGDTDGTTNPYDVGFGQLIDRKQGDYVGRRSLLRAHDRRTDRRQLVGLEPLDRAHGLVAGAHLVTGSGASLRSEGFVTSACHSPTLGRSIGLGLLEGGRARGGATVQVFDQGRTIAARVVAPAFYDPDGARMHG